MNSLFCETAVLDKAYALPTEIWEMILALLVLSPRALVLASRVCSKWRLLATRICQRFCSRQIGHRLLNELFETAVIHRKIENVKENDTNRWIKVFWLYHETFLDVKPQIHSMVAANFQSAINVTTQDPYLMISTYNEKEDETTTHVFAYFHFPFLEIIKSENHLAILLECLGRSSSFVTPGRVLKICLLVLPPPVLLVASSSEVKAVKLSQVNRTQRPRECKILITNPLMKGNFKISSEGCYFVTQDSNANGHLTLYEASIKSSDEEELSLSILCRFKTESSPYSCNLSRDLINTTETSGHMRSYRIKCLKNKWQNELDGDERKLPESEEKRALNRSPVDATELIAESDMKKDLRYPNPSVFTRDFLFSSTIVSRELLSYWHMDRDREFWLIGDMSPGALNTVNSAPSSIRRIHLHQVMLGRTLVQVVTSVHFQRGILLCGTSEGHLLGYKDFYDDAASTECFDNLRGFPWLRVTGIATQAISRICSLFTPLGMLVAVGESSGKCSIVFLPCEDISW